MVIRTTFLLSVAGIFASLSALMHRPSTNATFPPAQTHAAAADDSLGEQLTRLERQSWVAWQHHDGDFFRSFLSDDHVEVGTSGIATKAQVVGYVASGACVVASYTVDHFHTTRFDDNTALLTYRAEQHTTCGKAVVPSPTWVSSLFVRRGGRWMNALYQHTKAE